MKFVRMKQFALVLALLAASPSFAATFRYSSSNNRIYIENGGSAATLTDVKNALPNAPLDQVSTSPNVWLLRANLNITGGSTLLLHGTSIGGDVDELRIQSNNDSTGFVIVTADYGTIDIDTTKITSWDAAVSGPDTNESNGRAYIHVRSSYASDGTTPLESHMDVANSEISYLGYNASEAYGLVWKVNVPTIADYANVNVWGSISNSHIHHNHYAVYTFGHQDGVFSNNEIDHNTGYGLDMHDDTDNLLVDSNNVHDNGNHGIIFSKRCDHAVIRNNDSYNNVGNGIMVHRSSDDALIENNRSHDNTDSGVAIFGTSNTEVRNNTLLNNGNAGVRISVGGTGNNVHDNEIGNGPGKGFYFYQGTDTPEPGDNGRPKNTTIRNNTVHDIGGDGIKMSDSDTSLFAGNTFTNVGSLFEFATSSAIDFNSNAVPTTVTIKASGSSSHPTVLTARPAVGTSLKVQMADAYSTFKFRSSARAIFDLAQNVFTGVSASSSLLTLNQANTGGAATVYARKMFATPATNQMTWVNITQWSTNRVWQAHNSTAHDPVTWVVGSLVPGAQYLVKTADVTTGVYTADSSGQISFAVSAGTVTTITYSVTKQ